VAEANARILQKSRRAPNTAAWAPPSPPSCSTTGPTMWPRWATAAPTSSERRPPPAHRGPHPGAGPDQHGVITREQANHSRLKHILTRSMGGHEEVQLDLRQGEAQPGTSSSSPPTASMGNCRRRRFSTFSPFPNPWPRRHATSSSSPTSAMAATTSPSFWRNSSPLNSPRVSGSRFQVPPPIKAVSSFEFPSCSCEFWVSSFEFPAPSQNNTTRAIGAPGIPNFAISILQFAMHLKCPLPLRGDENAVPILRPTVRSTAPTPRSPAPCRGRRRGPCTPALRGTRGDGSRSASGCLHAARGSCGASRGRCRSR